MIYVSVTWPGDGIVPLCDFSSVLTATGGVCGGGWVTLVKIEACLAAGSALWAGGDSWGQVLTR